MQTVLGRIIKYILRVLLILILSLLLVGLVKYRGDVRAYIDFLNTRDRNEARGQLSISQPSSFANMFRGEGMPVTWQMDLLTGETLTGEASTWLDAYDPSREEELANPESNSMNDSGFWFQESSGSDSTSQEDLLNLIKERELNK